MGERRQLALDKTTIEEIIASLDRLNILELQQLTDVRGNRTDARLQSPARRDERFRNRNTSVHPEPPRSPRGCAARFVF